MWYKNVSTTFFRFVTKHAFDRKTDIHTDRQTDSFLVARPRCTQCMQRGKNDNIMLFQRRQPPISQPFERHDEIAASELFRVHWNSPDVYPLDYYIRDAMLEAQNKLQPSLR